MFETKKTMANLFGVSVICAAFLISGCKGRPNAAVIPTNSLATVTATPPVSANTDSKKVKFTSVFTKLDSKTCKPIRKAESDEEEVPDICDGYKDYKIFVSHHGTATRIYIGREITADADAWDASTFPMFIANGAGDGQTIEWRLADGEPFACIVRAEYDKQIINPDEKGAANEFVVKNLKGFAPIDIVIDAKKSSRANDEARGRADAGYGKP